MMRGRLSGPWARLWLIGVLLVLGSMPARAAEEILSFSSNVFLMANGSVDVTETIEVRAEGDQIRRGIFRDVPTVMTNADGSTLRSNFNVVSVKRDGEDEPWHTEGIRDGVRVYIGDSDVFLPPNTYTYELRYTMTRMARRFEDHDELYWNATGNFWAFPIKAAVAQITLPEGAAITELNAYTGRFGESGSDVKITKTSPRTAIFRATRSLAAGEGLTVQASFEKGALDPVGPFQGFLNFLSDHRGLVFPPLAVLIALIYNLFAWDAVGRDPKKGTIIPLFQPPEGFSPALVHYVHSWGWKKSGWTAYSAALVSLAVKQLIEIGKEGKDSVFTSLKRPDTDLPSGEAVAEAYIRSTGKLRVDKAHGTGISKNKTDFLKAIESENRQVYFKKNFLYVIGGAVLALAMLAGLVVMGALDPIWLVLAFIAGIAIALVSSVFGKFSRGGTFVRIFMFVWIFIFGSNVIGAVGSVFTGFEIDMGAISAISIVVLTVVFGFLMRAPTLQGRKIMDQIDGFRMYLETAEKERLNFAGEPEFSISRFETILPYAIALGVEKPWADRLEGELSRNALPEARGGYHPLWYTGAAFSGGNLSRDVAGIASGMSAAMISAQPVSSSSSGGGGGGFSGGGGGGGGGGGW